jgi:predicted nuclease of restriction endonuclease-like (RecB) superfamily
MLKRYQMKKINKTNNEEISPLNYRDDFEAVCDIIATHRNRVVSGINNESLMMVWKVGGFISYKLKSSAWGDSVVRMLADYIHTRNPKAKGWSYRTMYKMVQLYESYASSAFIEMVNHYGMQHYLSDQLTGNEQNKDFSIVPFETAQNQSSEIVPFEMAQIPSVLFSTGWTNHQIIMNRCRSNEERLFYMLYAGREKLQNKELIRAISTNAMASILGSKNAMTKAMSKNYPSSPFLFKDRVYLDMLGLPERYKETKLRKSIVSHMKDFILELGKDFLFIDEEHRLTVGGKIFKVDLLFYHRLLQCMVAIELKTTEFHPKDLGQLEFYLEALDQEERRSNENPSIGILLCKEADMEVVRFALNRSMSPTMVALYKEQLQVGSVIQQSLVEFCRFINEEK